MNWSRLTLFTLLLLSTISSFANDGAFFASGNQLIPMVETDISVQKEVLRIKRKSESEVDVIVYYEFYNPKETKQITVGFEAPSPSGDVDATPKGGKHPYIYDFTVEMNNTILPYEVSIVEDSLYYQNGVFKSLNKDEINERNNINYADFNFVYHFTANFKKGLNIIKHTYTCELSGSVIHRYNFNYILSAAMRWGNHQIDDFTLIVDMGDFEDFYINDAPFLNKWEIEGIGNILEKQIDEYLYDDESGALNSTYNRFTIRKGQAIYKQRNYKTKNELEIYSARVPFSSPFHYKGATLPYYLDSYAMEYLEVEDEMSKKVLRNIPFARRGYIFSTKELQDCYSSQVWYIPDNHYKSRMESLTKEEQEWVKHWSK